MSLPVLFTPAESGRRRVSPHWYETTRRDPVAIAIYHRHYSCKQARATHCSAGIVGPGGSMTLIGPAGTALFVWRRQQFRLDFQTGIECSIFRNESSIRSSELIREAVALAHTRWPGARLYSFVDPRRVRSTNPGCCFIKAGWRRKGTTPKGLVILEA